MRPRVLTAFLILILIFSQTPLSFAETLKGIYSGSGGMSADVHRVIMVEFAEDGSALVQQNWVGKDPQVWHARWTQEGKQVTITFDTSAKGSPQKPLVMEVKRNVLTPTSWDTATLGVMGHPKMTPFGGKNVKQHSVMTCQAINSAGPAGQCATWDSRNK